LAFQRLKIHVWAKVRTQNQASEAAFPRVFVLEGMTFLGTSSNALLTYSSPRLLKYMLVVFGFLCLKTAASECGLLRFP
jgi:hypothetical protein